MDTPQVDDMLIWLGGLSAALLALTTFMVVFKKWLIGDLSQEISDIQKELHPNGGSSVRDAIDRIADKQSDIQSDVKDLKVRVDDHIVWHLEQH